MIKIQYSNILSTKYSFIVKISNYEAVLGCYRHEVANKRISCMYSSLPRSKLVFALLDIGEISLSTYNANFMFYAIL